MPAPYAVDLRERAVRASDTQGLARAALLFQVGEATPKRWRRRARETGSLAPSPMGGDRRAGAATAAKLEEAVGEKPGRILREVVEWFLAGSGRLLSLSGISRALRRAGLRRRCETILAAERQDDRVIQPRKEYLAAIAGIDPARLVFLAFLREVRVPEFRPGDVVVMDNLGAYKAAGGREVIEAAGATILYLPPCSPELNPIENAWSKLKTHVRAASPQALATLHAAIASATSAMGTSDAMGWFHHCGYGLVQA
jgi:transposase